VTVSSPAARVLLIADDARAGEIYCRVLEFVGYDVKQAADFDEVVGTSMADPDVIVFCSRATLGYSGEAAEVIRIPEGTPPDVLVADVYRRVAPCPVEATRI
jgi:DNA-binding response OmpR family regulator